MSYLVKVEVLNVGQGLGVLLDFGDGAFGVYDCGPRAGAANVLYRELRRRLDEGRLKVVEFLALSHLDVDHIGGLSDILDDSEIRSRIKRIVCNDSQYRLTFELLRRAARSLAEQVDSGEAGVLRHEGSLARIRSLRTLATVLSEDGPFEHIEVALSQGGSGREIFRSSRGARVVALGPTAAMRNLARSAVPDLPASADFREIFRSLPELEEGWNHGSIVLSVQAGGQRLLLPGDMTWQALQSIVQESKRRKALSSRAVVAWHHGARLWNAGDNTRDCQAWELALGGPECIAIISCGTANRYGHPHEESLQGIRSEGGRAICTQHKDFDSVGGSDASGLRDFLELLPHTSISFRRRSGRPCWGDITIEVSEDGNVSFHGHGNHEGHPCSVACCRFEGFLSDSQRDAEKGLPRG